MPGEVYSLAFVELDLLSSQDIRATTASVISPIRLLPEYGDPCNHIPRLMVAIKMAFDSVLLSCEHVCCLSVFYMYERPSSWPLHLLAVSTAALLMNFDVKVWTHKATRYQQYVGYLPFKCVQCYVPSSINPSIESALSKKCSNLKAHSHIYCGIPSSSDLCNRFRISVGKNKRPDFSAFIAPKLDVKHPSTSYNLW